MPPRLRAGQRGGSTLQKGRSSMSKSGHSDQPDHPAATADHGTGGSGSPMAEPHASPPKGDEEKEKPGLQVIVLGSGGGPIETNTTAFLVRSVASGWNRGSTIAVDAGVHLAAMMRILESTQPKDLGTKVSLPHTLESGPFAGLEVRSSSPIANASQITQTIIDTFLITHPHLDHISAFVVNTAGLGRPKRLAGLQDTISAFKDHIFNNIIWPNLTDENNGAGLVTYIRLVEGGSPAMGEDGYMEISDNLLVKTWGVSHGHCIERHKHRGSQGSPADRHGSHDQSSISPMPRSSSHLQIPKAGSKPTLAPNRFPSHLQPPASCPSPGGTMEHYCVYDSSAYFIRDKVSGKEVLIFGDVEPDSISLSPRNIIIWQDAAPKIAAGKLGGIFIECSYDNSQPVERLFGHLTPCYIIEELRTLAAEVEHVRKADSPDTKKRKRAESHSAGGHGGDASANPQNPKKVCDEPVSPKTVMPPPGPSTSGPSTKLPLQVSGQEAEGPKALAHPVAHPPGLVHSLEDEELKEETTSSPTPTHTGNALKGLKVVIMHVKDRLSDGPPVGDRIMQELLEAEENEKLGCEFIVSQPGESVFL